MDCLPVPDQEALSQRHQLLPALLPVRTLANNTQHAQHGSAGGASWRQHKEKMYVW